MTIGLASNQASPEVTVNQMVMGYTTKSVAGGSTVTLTDVETTWAAIEFTGALTADIDVKMSGDTAKQYLLFNNTTGPYTLTFKTNTGTVGVTIPQGATAQVFNNGTVGADMDLMGLSYGGNPFFVQYYETAAQIASSVVDLSLGTYFYQTVAASVTYSFTNPAPSGNVSSFTMELTNGGVYVTWPTAVDWPGGTAPTLTTSGVDIFTFVTRDNGTTWHGMTVSLDSK